MVTMEYDNTKINVPTSWEDVKLGVYEEVYALKPVTARDRVAYVAKICQVEPEVLLNWPAEVFNKLVTFIDFLFIDADVPPCPFIEVDGVKYVVPIDDKITLGQWVDVDEAQKAGTAVLSNVLAIICRPTGETYSYEQNEARAAMFADLPVSRVLGVLAFFLHCKAVFDQHTAAFLKIQELADLLPRNTVALLSRGAGIKLSQIWRIPRYLALIALLRYRLRKYSPSYNTGRIKTARKWHKRS
jgi:hypothetical protein